MILAKLLITSVISPLRLLLWLHCCQCCFWQECKTKQKEFINQKQLPAASNMSEPLPSPSVSLLLWFIHPLSIPLIPFLSQGLEPILFYIIFYLISCRLKKPDFDIKYSNHDCLTECWSPIFNRSFTFT